MSTYLAVYHSNAANMTIKDTLASIGNRPYVVMVDLLLDGQCISLSHELQNMRYNTKIHEVQSFSLEDVSYKLSSIINEIRTESLRTGVEEGDFYLEVGGLEHVMAGAVYSAAFREGGIAVYMEEDRVLKKIPFQPAPDVSRVGYLPRLTLDVLHDNGDMDTNSLARLLYADQIVKLTEEEITDFFRQNHNTYKVLENLENKKWIRYNNDTKKYGITELGNTARAMLNLRAEKQEKSTSKKRGRRSETVE